MNESGRKYMKAQLRGKLITASAIFAVVGLAVAAVPANALPYRAETGVTSKNIKLGITLPMTDAASPGYNKIPGAMKAYFAYVNANGGVNGRSISLVVKDDKYVPTLAAQNAKDLIIKDKVFALVGALGTSSNKAISAPAVQLASKGVPSLFVNTGFSGFSDPKKYPTTFSILPSYQMEAKIIAKYVKDTYPGKKVGLLYQNDDFGRDALAGFKQAGLKIDVPVPYAPLTQAVDGVPAQWITALQNGGAEVTILFGVSSATIAALGNAYAKNFKTQWILGSVGGDATTIAASKKIPVALMAGAKGLSFAPAPTDTSDDYIKLFQDINTRYNTDSEKSFDNNIVAGMSSAFLVVQAIKAAGPNLTRRGLIKAIEDKGSSFANPFLTPLGYSKSAHIGATGYWIGTYNQAGSLISDAGAGKYNVFTTDSGSGDVVKSTYVRPAMPAKGLPN